jgi:hypothetical protein
MGVGRRERRKPETGDTTMSLTYRTYAILSQKCKKLKLDANKASKWFDMLDIHFRRDMMKSGNAVTFIIDNADKWSK